MFFDSHAHIGAPELLSEAGEILQRARDAGVSGVIAIGAGYGVGPNAGAVAVADQHSDVWATAGIHPHDAHEWNDIAATAVDGWSAHERVVAIGECGLDYFYDHSPRETQDECLRGQIRLAKRTELPLVIHVRPSQDSHDAFEDILRIFDEEGANEVGGVIHCFTGDLEFAEDCMARAFDISFSGIITFKNAAPLRDVAKVLPMERLLIETDAPLLAPVPYRGKRNEPAFLVETAACLAELHGRSIEAVATATRERAHQAFGLANS